MEIVTWQDINGYYSHSQISMYRRCAKQFEFRYVKKLKRAPKSSMILGTSAHAGMELNLLHKFKKKTPAKLSSILDVFSTEWEANRRGAEFDGIKPGTIKDKGVEILKLHYTKAAPSLIPTEEPEQEFLIEMPGVSKPIKGFIDFFGTVRKVPNVVLDHKTTSRMKKQYDIDIDDQLTMYGYARMKLSGKMPTWVGNDVYVANRSAEDFERIMSLRSLERYKALELTVQMVDRGIRTGIFPATSNTQTCGWCGYQDICTEAKRAYGEKLKRKNVGYND